MTAPLNTCSMIEALSRPLSLDLLHLNLTPVNCHLPAQAAMEDPIVCATFLLFLAANFTTGLGYIGNVERLHSLNWTEPESYMTLTLAGNDLNLDLHIAEEGATTSVNCRERPGECRTVTMVLDSPGAWGKVLAIFDEAEVK